MSPRVDSALAARAASVNDFFGGWEVADVEYLAGWAPDPLTLKPIRGVLVDWLGGRTSLNDHAWLTVPDDGCIVVADLPVPDDQVHAETIEYYASLSAIERAKARGDSYVMFELGSSYAPWSVTSALVADRVGFQRIDICAVEASAATIERVHAHIRLNELHDRAHITWHVVNAAVAADPGVLYFPRVDTRADNGAQVSSSPAGVDYRGVPVQYDEVDAVTFEQLTQGLERVDFVHLDLQGAEEALLSDDRFLDVISTKVSAMLLATQSRLIEGLALRALSRSGWRLVRERPTMFSPNQRTADVNGWTIRDGAQFWLNSRFG